MGVPKVTDQVADDNEAAYPHESQHGWLDTVQVVKTREPQRLQGTLKQTFQDEANGMRPERGYWRQNLSRMVDFVELPEKRNLVLDVVSDGVTDVEEHQTDRAKHR